MAYIKAKNKSPCKRVKKGCNTLYPTCSCKLQGTLSDCVGRGVGSRIEGVGLRIDGVGFSFATAYLPPLLCAALIFVCNAAR
jgi:hypothetical protein